MKSVTWVKCDEVIICYEHIGKGTDDDPVRELVVVRDKEGNFIAEHDPHEKSIP